MSDFTDRVGSSLMGTMGAVAAAQAEAEARSAEVWKAWAQYYKNSFDEASSLFDGVVEGWSQ